jgi:hypothetical protein
MRRPSGCCRLAGYRRRGARPLVVHWDLTISMSPRSPVLHQDTGAAGIRHREALFHTHCAGCHGPAGVNWQGPSFLSRVLSRIIIAMRNFYLAVKQGSRPSLEFTAAYLLCLM